VWNHALFLWAVHPEFELEAPFIRDTGPICGAEHNQSCSPQESLFPVNMLHGASRNCILFLCRPNECSGLPEQNLQVVKFYFGDMSQPAPRTHRFPAEMYAFAPDIFWK
jgi:hypothetical protein